MITSPRNPTVAAARRLAAQRTRAEQRRFLLEGARGIGAAVEAGAAVQVLAVTPAAAARHPDLVAAARAAGARGRRRPARRAGRRRPA